MTEYIVWIEIEKHTTRKDGSDHYENVDCCDFAGTATFRSQEAAARFAARLDATGQQLAKEGA
jgi:hypothetical protein